MHGQKRGRARRHALFDVMFDRLDDDDGIVDDDADGEDQAEQGQVVDTEAHDLHDREGADDGHGYRDQRNHRRPPVLQEDQDDDGHEDDGVDVGYGRLRRSIPR